MSTSLAKALQPETSGAGDEANTDVIRPFTPEAESNVHSNRDSSSAAPQNQTHAWSETPWSHESGAETSNHPRLMQNHGLLRQKASRDLLADREAVPRQSVDDGSLSTSGADSGVSHQLSGIAKASKLLFNRSLGTPSALIGGVPSSSSAWSLGTLAVCRNFAAR